MRKNTLYLVATLVAIVIVALVMAPKKTTPEADLSSNPAAASPANGLVTTPPVTAQQPVPATPGAAALTPDAMAPAPATALPAPAAAAPALDAIPAAATNIAVPAAPAAGDDVPATAEVPADNNPTASANGTPKPADDKGMAVPPSEGQ